MGRHTLIDGKHLIFFSRCRSRLLVGRAFLNRSSWLRHFRDGPFILRRGHRLGSLIYWP